MPAEEVGVGERPSCPLSTKAFSFACTALKPSADAGRGETEEQILAALTGSA